MAAQSDLCQIEHQLTSATELQGSIMSTAYNMVMTPAFFGAVRRGALDHWQGETVPVRGPNREIIGEATIVRVDQREDGNVWVIV